MPIWHGPQYLSISIHMLIIRQIGTIAGNLMIKHAHHDFPSDIFVTLEGLGAKINIGENFAEIYSLT